MGKKSAGGFIHGYRDLIKCVFHEFVQNNALQNTMIEISSNEIAKYVAIRMNSASSFYQMFAVMADVIIVRSNGATEYFYDLLMAQLNTLPNENCSHVIALTFDYHSDFIGHDMVLYDKDRVIQDFRKAKKSKFLHPVLKAYSYKVLKNRNDNSFKDYAKSKYKMSERHVIEDFLTL